MRKVNAIAVLDRENNICYSLAFRLCNGTTIQMRPYATRGNAFGYKDFDQLYELILRLAKNNDFRIEKFHDFEQDWYDIQFIDINNPAQSISRYAYHPRKD